MVNNGYIIPDNASPGDMDCILVFYPNDPTYLAALLGSITYLATWTAWERDPDKRGRIAAAAWKDANECTLDSMSCITDLVTALTSINQTLAAIQTAIENQSLSLDTANIEAAIGGVQTAIENLTFDSVMTEDDMSIVINNCCCGGSSSTPTIPGLPDNLPPNTQPPTPTQPIDDYEPFPPEEPEANWLQNECAMAQFLLFTFRKICLDAANGDFTQANMIAKLATYFPGSGWDFIGGAAQFALALLTVISNLVDTATIAAEIDSKFEAMKCALLNRNVSASERIGQIRVLIDLMALPTLTRYAMKFIVGYMPAYYVFDLNTLAYAESYLQDNGFFAAGCPACVDMPSPEPQPSTLFLRDHTSTAGQLWISTDGLSYSQYGYTSGFGFNFYQDYWLKGDAAYHLDCEITAASSASNRVDCDVTITNENLATISVGIQQYGVAGSVVILAGQKTTVRSSLIDFQLAITDARIKVNIAPAS